MKKGFDFPMPAEAWIPLALNVKERLQRDNRRLWVLGTAASHGFFFRGRRGDASSLRAAKRKLTRYQLSLASAPTTAATIHSPER